MPPNAQPDELQDFKDAVGALHAASKVPAKSRARKITPTIHEICEYAFQSGFPPDELLKLINLVTTRTELDQTSTTTLIKNLYPAANVPSEAVCAIVASLGHAKRKPSPSTQAALVRWLSAVHGVLEDHSILTQFYAVLFNLLDMITIRAPLCHLLALITRRKHVRPFRIQRLLELSQLAGNEPALAVLMRVYKNYCPEIIMNTANAGRSLAQSQTDLEWRNRLQAIQDVSRSHGITAGDRGGFKVARNGVKKNKLSIVPEVHTFHASETLVTLEDVESAGQFAENLEKLEPPSQLVAGLRDPLLQKYLMLGSSADSKRRLEFWLSQYFEEELETLREGFGLSATLSDTLSAIVSYTESSKALLPVVQQFLTTYIPLWNGSSDLGLIMDLVAYVPPQPFAELQSIILAPLEKSILHGAHAPFETLFEFYSNLAQRWILTLSNSTTQKHAYDDLCQHVAVLAQSAMSSTDSSSTSILTFYEKSASTTNASITSGTNYIPIILPPPSLIYNIAMIPSLTTLSRISALLTTYKTALQTQIQSITAYHAESTKILNGYLMDICNLLWRSRALTTSDTNSFGCLCPDPVTTELTAYISRFNSNQALNKSFDFSHNPLIASLSWTAFAEFQKKKRKEMRHDGPVTQQSLVKLGNEGGVTVSWKEYRVMILGWLEERGMEGFKLLMFATMKDLMK
ncbi:Mis6-domain-containing protein [Venturia nashicola]|uniref:Mis6-domain-containing protein n=1 Tax=Venturia nashicola TaxID=86259 RepID=A0A4Z1P6F3_9PEZI|nr:Mis6-domain-containing protein [Venturia nashicola]TLD31754.1 Mis6-domain-containing protein [Venturia nashicola]